MRNMCSAYVSPKKNEVDQVEIAASSSTRDTIIFAFSCILLVVLRLWSFKTRLIRTRPPLDKFRSTSPSHAALWTVWQGLLMAGIVLLNHFVPVLGTLVLDDPWGSESWAWAQCVQPLLSAALVWCVFGSLKDDA